MPTPIPIQPIPGFTESVPNPTPAPDDFDSGYDTIFGYDPDTGAGNPATPWDASRQSDIIGRLASYAKAQSGAGGTLPSPVDGQWVTAAGGAAIWSALPVASPSQPGIIKLGSGALDAMPGNTVIPAAPPSATSGVEGVLKLTGDLAGSAGSPQVAQARALKSATTTVNTDAAAAPSAGQVLTATDTTHATWQTPASSSAPDASTTVKGIAELSVAPSGTPKAVGDNDPRLLDVLDPGRVTANPEFAINSGNTGALTATLKPQFYPIRPWGSRKTTIAQFATRIKTLSAGSHIGIAIYDFNWTAAGVLAATKLAALATALSGASVGEVVQALAANYLLDFTLYHPFIAVMATDTTVALPTGSPSMAKGGYKWTAAARASATDWPGSFTQTSITNAGTADNQPYVELVTANGALFL